MRGLIAFFVVVAVLAGSGVMVAKYFKPTTTELPSVRVSRGDLLVKSYARGELRAVTAAMIVGPNLGGTLLISGMAQTGNTVNKDDVVLEFDRAEQQNHLDTHKSLLSEAEEEIRKNRADAAVRAQNDKVEQMRAEFAVRRAELDVSRNELVSEIDARKNELALEAARKKLKQLREDIESRAKSSDADLAMANERKKKAQLLMNQAQRRIEQTAVKSPIAGLVSVRTNRFASDMWFPGIDIPDYRVGDQAFSGDTILDVVATEQMEVIGKVNELDRGNLKEGQEVIIRLDGLPGEVLTGKVKSLAGMTSRQFFGDPTKTFDVVFTITQQHSSLRPGMSAEVEIITERMKDVIYVPVQAVFDKDGKKWVYVKSGKGFQSREVTAGRRSESQIMIAKGLSGNEQIALLDPEARNAGSKKGKNPLGGPGLGK